MKSLFDKTRLNTLSLRNRCVRSATWDGMADEKGHPRRAHERIYEELAAGGIGLIVTGVASVLGPTPGMPGMFGIYDDEFIGEYERITSRVHRHNVPIVMQISYQGSQGSVTTAGRRLWGLSAIENRATGITPKEMTKGDISLLVASYAQAAGRAKEAGFDGVQLHAAHGFFLSQSLSRYYNRRSDEYGGSTRNRARLLYEVCTAVRETVGNEYLLMVKVDGEGLPEGGPVLEESVAICQGLQECGIDAIEVSGREGTVRTDLERPEDQSYYAPQATRIAEQLSIPVLLVGGNRDPRLLEEVLNTTPVEHLSFSRPLIREPDLVRRWQSGDLTAATCTSCNWCMENAARGENLACVFEKDESRT